MATNSVSYPTAQELSTCSVSSPRFDGLVTDQFIDKLHEVPIGSECRKQAIVTSGDRPAINFVTSGSSVTESAITWQAGTDLLLARMALIVPIDGVVADLLGSREKVADIEAKLALPLFKQKMGQQLFALSPDPAGFTGLPAASLTNPLGEIDAAGAAVSINLMEQLKSKIAPWSPTSDLAYVMHSSTYTELVLAALASGTEIPADPDPQTGERWPRWGPFRILISDWISRSEPISRTSVYLVRMGRGPQDPEGIEGVSFLCPAGREGLQISSIAPNSGSADQWKLEIQADRAFYAPPGSVARAKNVLANSLPPP